MTKKIGLFYGSTTGNTEHVAKLIQEMLGKEAVQIFDIDGSTIEDVNQFENLVFGIPTWDIGELQEDWVSWISHIDDPAMVLSGKKFAVFGVGDQEGYPDTFGDAIGILYDKLIKRGALPVIDQWPTSSYKFDESKGFKNGFFVGMLCDEDNQPELTKSRVQTWVELAKKAFA